MKIGYPCVNTSIEARSSRTFRLASYTPERLIETVRGNLAGLEEILRWNADRGILFFRISSDLVPFASHPVCRIRWWRRFGKEFASIGRFIRRFRMRISMHPDQFTLINARDPAIVRRSVAELLYHTRILDVLGLPASARIQIHVGGLYGERDASRERFVRNFLLLPGEIRKRLVIENDDRLWSLAECLRIHASCGVPVLLDTFHHSVLNRGETLPRAFDLASATWQRRDGAPMVDYSSQEEGKRRGAHAVDLDERDFREFLENAKGRKMDVMLEIKSKERAALAAKRIAEET